MSEEEFEENEPEPVEEFEDPEPVDEIEYPEDLIVPTPDPEPEPDEDGHCCCDCIYIADPTGLVHFYDQPLTNPTSNPHITIDGDNVTLVSWVSGPGNESGWAEFIRTGPTSHRQTAWRVTFSISEIVGWLIHPFYSDAESPSRSHVLFSFRHAGSTAVPFFFKFYRVITGSGISAVETTYRARFFSGAGITYPTGWPSDSWSFPFEPDDEITIEYNRPRHSETRRLRCLLNGEVAYSIPLSYDWANLKDCQDWEMVMAMRAFGPSVAIGHVTRSRFIQDWYNGWLLQNWIDSDFSDWTLSGWTVPQNGQLRNLGTAWPNSIEIPLTGLVPGGHYKLTWQSSQSNLSGVLPGTPNSFWASTVNGVSTPTFTASGRRANRVLPFVAPSSTPTIVLSGTHTLGGGGATALIASGFSLLAN